MTIRVGRSIDAPQTTDDRTTAEWVLSVGGNIKLDLGKDWIEQLPDGPITVTEIDLTQAKISDNDLKKLSQLTQLKYLNLSKTYISNVGLEHLAGLDTLEYLNVGYCRDVTDRAMASISQLTGLKHLGVGQTGLRNMPNLKKLNKLEFFAGKSSPLTDLAFEQLRRLPALGQVLADDTEITDKGLGYLAGCPSLTVLYLNKTEITPAGIEAFKKAKPGCKVYKAD